MHYQLHNTNNVIVYNLQCDYTNHDHPDKI